jgi:hypothetical protein
MFPSPDARSQLEPSGMGERVSPRLRGRVKGPCALNGRARLFKAERVEQPAPQKAPGDWRSPKPAASTLPLNQPESRDGFLLNPSRPSNVNRVKRE